PQAAALRAAPTRSGVPRPRSTRSSSPGSPRSCSARSWSARPSTRCAARIEARLQRQTDEAPRLVARAEKLRAECARMVELAMGAPKGVEVVFYEQIAERKAELDGVEAQLRATNAAPSAIDLELRRMMVE